MTHGIREQVAEKLGDDDQEQHMAGFHRKTCLMCKVQFIALRSDKLTCGARCRKWYERECRKITERERANDAKQAERFEQLCEDATAMGE